MLVRGRTSGLPGHNEVRYIHGGVATLPPAKQKPPSTVQRFLSHSTCLVLGHSTGCLLSHSICLVLGYSTGCLLSHSTCLVRGHSTGCLLSHSTCLVIGHSSRAEGGNPPRTPPSSTGCLLSHSTWSRAWTQQPCRGGKPPPGPPPSSTPPGAGSQIYLLIFNKTSEEDDTREIDVGTEQVIASKGSTKDGATVRNDDHNLASPDGEEPLVDDIDVGEDTTPEPKPSRTQQDIPDASRDARLDVDLGSMTAQKWSQEQLQEPVCKSTNTLLQQGLSGASPQDIILQFPIRVRPTVQQVSELTAKTKLFTTEGNFPLLVKRNTSSAELSHSGGRVLQNYVPTLMRPWVLRGCHADSVCHFEVTRTLQILQRFYWWVGLDKIKVYDGGLEDVSSAKHERYHARRSDGRLH